MPNDIGCAVSAWQVLCTVHDGQWPEKNDWQFSNPRIDTGYGPLNFGAFGQMGCGRHYSNDHSLATNAESCRKRCRYMVPLNTSGHRGASFHSREPKARVGKMYPYFVLKRFINHIIINKSCQTCPAHIVKCHNAKTGVTATLLTMIFEPKTAVLHER